MQFKTQAVVVGMTRSKGQGDGQNIAKDVTWDNTKFFVQQDLTDKRGNSRGQCTTEIRVGDSKRYEEFESVQLPCWFEFDMKITGNGKGQQTTECLGVRMLPTEARTAPTNTAPRAAQK